MYENHNKAIYIVYAGSTIKINNFHEGGKKSSNHASVSYNIFQTSGRHLENTKYQQRRGGLSLFLSLSVNKYARFCAKRSPRTVTARCVFSPGNRADALHR